MSAENAQLITRFYQAFQRLDAEGLPEAAHRQPREALLVDVGDRGVEDPSAVERDVP